MIKNQAPSLSVIVDPATNRVTQQGGSAISYDANGNPTVAYGPGGTMGLTYDGQNRLIKAGNDSYAYDPAGRREWKLIGPDNFFYNYSNNDEFYMYDLSGHRVGTYKYTATINPPQGYFTATERDYWFGNRLIYRWTANAAGPVMQDRLGSVRADSGTGSAVYSGFYPYGEEKGNATANDRVKFGTYRRDSDTGLDYAEQRYYSSAMGRFLRPDPYGGSASVMNPQSWNRYGYVLNDPANANDPSGMDAMSCVMPNGEGGQPPCSELDVAYQQYANNQDANFLGNLVGQYVLAGNEDGANLLMSQSGGTVTSYSFVSSKFAGQTDSKVTVYTDPISYSQQMPAPLTGLPDSFFILPRGLGPVVRVFGSNGSATIDIHYQPNHPEVGNPHVHYWDGNTPSGPKPVPPGSAIPDEPRIPPGAEGPYSPWPQEPTPIIAPALPGVFDRIFPIIIVNPCMFPILHNRLPSCGNLGSIN